MIDVLFFAELQEAVGQEKVSLQIEGITVKDLKTKWLAEYELDNIDDAMVAVNEEYAQEDTVLASGDVIAFIPPVSGG
ncbi:molybdopterin converting factor subunit 1 [Virgibacillus profundi]|uniref:Molybdopterin synthase sulfur carrier subunit n=1 Tax=Virgibacillus profundi TaxID=2024555 RepID=A0A2A2ID22_9BACI|nr:molybdopterin converting factor subunit 1 [Virgibacillus profundi]PAV29216.1 molybdopterin converting factor subunit 1 [Virgibacillus profundi]PXY53385.1 molybdopterin converting factor subunit 1 [Virgibacillus profundi]